MVLFWNIIRLTGWGNLAFLVGLVRFRDVDLVIGPYTVWALHWAYNLGIVFVGGVAMASNQVLEYPTPLSQAIVMIRILWIKGFHMSEDAVNRIKGMAPESNPVSPECMQRLHKGILMSPQSLSLF